MIKSLLKNVRALVVIDTSGCYGSRVQVLCARANRAHRAKRKVSAKSTRRQAGFPIELCDPMFLPSFYSIVLFFFLFFFVLEGEEENFHLLDRYEYMQMFFIKKMEIFAGVSE